MEAGRDEVSTERGDDEGEVTVPPATLVRAYKRKRDEEEDEYEVGDEDEVVNVIDKEAGGPLQNVFKCLWAQSREIGYDKACHIAAEHFNDTVYRIDLAAGGRLVPGRKSMLTRKMTKSSMMRMADTLLHTKDGTESAITMKMEYLWECMQQLEEGGLWRCKDVDEPMFISDKAAKQYKMLLETWIKLKKERDIEVGKREKLDYKKVNTIDKTEVDPRLFRRFG